MTGSGLDNIQYYPIIFWPKKNYVKIIKHEYTRRVKIVYRGWTEQITLA